MFASRDLNPYHLTDKDPEKVCCSFWDLAIALPVKHIARSVRMWQICKEVCASRVIRHHETCGENDVSGNNFF